MATYQQGPDGQIHATFVGGNPELRALQSQMFERLSPRDREIIAGWEAGRNCLHGVPMDTPCPYPDCEDRVK